jgi:speckle-type POZ protein
MEGSLYGEHCWVEIDDMRADTFSNLLHFVYTDALPKPKPQEEAFMA